MEPKMYGYARVSSRDQNEERQVIAITHLAHDSFYENQQNSKKWFVRMLRQASFLPSEQSYRVKDA